MSLPSGLIIRRSVFRFLRLNRYFNARIPYTGKPPRSVWFDLGIVATLLLCPIACFLLTRTLVSLFWEMLYANKGRLYEWNNAYCGPCFVNLYSHPLLDYFSSQIDQIAIRLTIDATWTDLTARQCGRRFLAEQVWSEFCWKLDD